MRHVVRSILVVAWLGLAGDAVGATFTVNSTIDAPDANPNGTCATSGNVCTLRAAIQESNRLSNADTINVPAGTYTLTRAGRGENAGSTGDLDILQPVTIVGAGATSTIVDAAQLDRVFDVFIGAGGSTISGLTVRNGNAGTFGGCVWSNALLSMTGMRIETCTSSFAAGAIQNDNQLTLLNTTVSGSTTNDIGGGIVNANGGTLSMTGSTLSGNAAGGSGGGLINDGTATLTNVTVSGNAAGTDGGGIDGSDGELTLKNVTIAANSADPNRGGGFWRPAGITTVTNVIVAAGPSGGTCGGTGSLTSQGGNVDGGTTCGFAGAGDLSGTNPLLAPLGSNGGPTQTHALGAGSAAIDSATACPPPSTDQRGTARPLDGDNNGSAVCDRGALETTYPPPVVTTSTSTSTTTSTTLGGCQ